MDISFKPNRDHGNSAHERNPVSRNGRGRDDEHHRHDHGSGSGHSDDSKMEVSLLGTFDSGLGEGAAEIVAHDPATQRLFVTNAEDESVDILDISDPKTPTKIGSIDVSEINGTPTGGPNSVAVAKGIVAVAIEADAVTDPGLVAFFDADGNFLGSVAVGSLPDMLIFTPDGKKLLVANEGEADGGVDPKGSVSIIDLSAGVGSATVTTVDFTAFDAQQAALEAAGLRIFPGELLSDDVEPEYIAISEDGKTAFITLQEANAVAVLDIATATITEIQPLGAKDHSQDGNGLDASDEDGGINIQTWPVLGLYMPDAIASYDYKGKTYYVTANEGDDRGENERIKNLTLDPTAFPDAGTLQEDENIGRLAVSAIDGDTDGDGDYDQLYAYGARSFSIWDENGNLVFDSGDMIEQAIAEMTPELFNADDGDPAEVDTRSDAKGPEPEAVVIGEVNGKTYAFVGLERAGGGVMVFDITKPTDVEFSQYIRTEGDIAPEGLKFISAKDSPIGVPLLAVANEVSGTTSLYQINFDGKTIKGTNCDDKLVGTGGDDIIDGRGGDDKIFGLAGNDDLKGGDDDDAIFGGYGDDNIAGGKGSNVIDGGPGDDTVDYSGSKFGVNVNLAAGSATTILTSKGHITSEAAMVDGENGYKVLPLLTIGETVEDTSGALNSSTAGDYTPVGVLDGIGAYELDHKTVRVFVNHELQNSAGYAYEVSDGEGGSFSMTGARISYYDIDKNTKAIVDAGIAYNTIVDANGQVASDTSFLTEGFDGFSRFCSGNLQEGNQFGHGRGTVDTIYFAGEEDGGAFNPVGGAMWALDADTGTLYQLPALGRGAWENITQVDTGDKNHVAFILADDTAPFDADGDGQDEAAPLYLYVGEKDKWSSDFLERNGLADGKLYVFVPKDPATNSPLEFNGADSMLNGKWVELDTAQNLAMASEDGSTGFDEYGYPTQRNLWTQAEAAGAFQFSRPEDVATNPKNGKEFVLASTGVDTFDVDPVTSDGADTFGTVYTMKLNFSDIDHPTGKLQILYDGDEDTDRALRSPDNLDWADDGYIYVQEDRAEVDTLTGEPLFGPGATNPNEASIVRINPHTGEVTRVGHIDRDAVVPAGATDGEVGVSGAWETSGILDVSKLFGEKAGSLFLFDVQAHGIADQDGASGAAGQITDANLVEGGQLALLAAPHVTITKAVDVDTITDVENVVGSKNDDVIIGDEQDNVLDGNKGDDAIFGGGGNDTQIGGKGDDAHDGGEGEDTAVFSGNSEDYDIQIVDGVATVTDLRDGSPDGADTLYNMEKAQFANETVSLIEEQTFTLQLLHASDLEGGVDAIGRAANFAAIIDALEDEYENSITLSAGDNYIPGPFFNAAGDAATFNALFEGFYNEFFGLIDVSMVDPSADTNGDGFFDNGELNAYIVANGLNASDVYVTDINGDGFPDYFDEIDNFEGRVDISIMNVIGFDASALGNHEFDFGSDAVENIVNYDAAESNSLSGVGVSSIITEFGAGAVNYLQEVDWPGAQFPYLSANLDFSGDGEIGNLFTSDILPNTAFRSDRLSARANPANPPQTEPDSNDPKLAPATIIEEGGEYIGVVGATTQVLASISSPTGTTVIGGPFTSDDMVQLASVLQPVIDDLIAGDAGSGRPPVNKIILTSHLQQLALEQELAGLLHGVDIIIAGGNDTLLADATDPLRPGDVAAGDYPFQTTNADGDPVLIVSTDGEYSYVGRLVVDFDADGRVITSSLDPNVSGAYKTDDAGVLAVTGEADIATAIANSEKATDVQKLVDAVEGVVIARDGNVFGETDVYIDGVRGNVRTEETNLGNLSADANLAVAKSVDNTVLVSIKNGGGIRASIGEVDMMGNELPTQANPLSGKEAGEISQLDIENSLRFNNGLTLITLTAEQLLQTLEHAVAATAPGATPGQFGQVGGISFSFDATQPAGSRVQSVALVDDLGNKFAIVQNGEVIDGAPSAIRIVTLNFLANGGDNYPFDDFIAADPAFANRVDLGPAHAAGALDGNANFASFGSEQDALAEYLVASHPAVVGPDGPSDFMDAETAPADDTRIQNLAARADTVLDGAIFPGEGSVVINEIRIDQTGADNDEYFELFGTANQALDGLTYLVIGDGTGGSGVIEAVVDLSGQSLNGEGFFLAAESTFTLGTADLTTSLNFENGDNVTHLLVRGFTGADGQDLDTDDDGVLDATPWSDVLGSVALVTPTVPPAGDQVYSTTQVGPDGSFVPGHVYRSPDGGDWQIGEFAGGEDTPGATNTPTGPLAAAIYEIQGAAHRSPLEGSRVITSGIVTAIVAGSGFYLQDAAGDGDIATSDGIFVFGDPTGLAVGNEVEVVGTVSEYQFPPALSVTEIIAENDKTTVLSTDNDLPQTVLLGHDRIQPNDVIDDDGLTSFDPTTDAIDFLESLEGMRVEVKDPLVVAGTSRFGEIALAAGRSGEFGSTAVNAVVSEGDFNPEILLTDDVLITAPNATTGDVFLTDAVGVLDYTFGAYKLQLTEAPIIIPGGRAPDVTALTGDADHLTIATYNTFNLDPSDGDPGGAFDRLDALAQSIVNNLGSPDIIALEEIQDNSGETDNGVVDASQTLQELVDAISAAGGPTYAFAQIDPDNNEDGGAPGANIRSAFLYNPMRVDLDEASLQRIENDAFDAGGDGTSAEADYEGTRKPLVGEFTFISTGETVTVIGNHLKSKSQDDGLFGENQPPEEHTLAQRVDQATVINQFVADILSDDPNAKVIVLGDMNDFQFSDTLDALKNGNGGAAELINLVDDLPTEDQYSFIFNGNSQQLDHILVNDAIADNAEIDVVHINVGFGFPADNPSDHDPIVARVDLSDHPAAA